MERLVFKTRDEMGAAAAAMAADRIRAAMEQRGGADIILATGNSQFETLANLVAAVGIDWTGVAMFHLDEYIGIAEDHPASFRKYLRERFVEKVGGLREVNLVDGEAPDPAAECARLGAIIASRTIDVALVGIGENGHLAFNDPPADFETDEPYIVVELDEKCRAQQLGEGWFPDLEAVPRRAISMSICQIMKSECLVVSVPDERKARAVRMTLEGEISNTAPASIMRKHPDCAIFLDEPAASLLSGGGGQ
jgi:glucosamine-6-phosphate deaminase